MWVKSGIKEVKWMLFKSELQVVGGLLGGGRVERLWRDEVF
jgi:hypothetical protein